jgi:hypothetical protein
MLETLGVIVLLGLASTLIFPQLIRREEKTQMQYIGKLLISDLQLIQETAVFERDPAGVNFTADGYQYNLGDKRFTRSFTAYGFYFQVTTPEDSEDSEESVLAAPDTLTFADDGSCKELTLDWESNNFYGSLQVQADGTVSWKYENKKRHKRSRI